MRIAYLSGAGIPSRGANSVHVMRMCNALALRGHRVELHAHTGPLVAGSPYDFYGITPTFGLVLRERLKIRMLGAIGNAISVRQHFRARQLPDLFYARELWALCAVAGFGVPMIFELHWIPRSETERIAIGYLLKRPNLRRVILISEALRQRYLHLFPEFARVDSLVCHDAADVGPVGEGSACRDRISVGYVGSFFPGNGVGLVAELAQRMPDLDFNVVGGSATEASELADRAGRPANLFCHGFVAPKDLPRMYARFDIVVAPYQADGPSIEWASPMKLFEYMAFGKAIVCSDFPVLREILENGRTALLVPPSSIDAWVEALRTAADNARSIELGNAARCAVEERFTWQKRAERVYMGLNIDSRV